METNAHARASSRVEDGSRPTGGSDLPSQVDILVVGLGPVGAMVANLLARHGVSVMAIDKAPDIHMAPRAIALDNEALRILQQAGIGEGDFETVAIPYVRMRSPWLGEFGRVNTLGSLDGHPKLVTFYQPDLERCLRARLATHDGVHIALGTTLLSITHLPDCVLASLDVGRGQVHRVRARYVVGADGASSVVRHLIGQEFRGTTYAEDWLVVDARHVPKPIDHVEFLCDHRRPTPHMVAPGGRERWEFMLHPGESREEMESDNRIRALLQPWTNVDDITIERKAVYRFHARTVDRFSVGRVFLVGDAAHITPPFVGQGLVAGLRDAANLSWKLAWVLQGRADARILDSYDEERRPHAKAMINLARFMGKLVMPRSAPIALLTHGLMRLTRLVPGLRSQFEELRIKPQNAFKTGLFVEGCSSTKLTRGGVLPQGWVRNADGRTCLSDDVLGHGYTLVSFGCDTRTALEPATAAAFARLGGVFVQIAHRGQSLPSEKQCVWEDINGAFLPDAVPVGWVAVVRPDRTVVHDGPAAEADRLVRESLALLGGQADPMPATAATVQSA
ncbi:bifunctional 3-(3-hydroxy-phenyl)propionate/3-hydroxycinnamic acid hydroxylase [Ralstonia sp. 24A2]|uniref:bifunctional 3-(3-hydroxy-phenyl)propionate/3-hydroxycinnamic acid hydroxylase n=1 Tax=Ralstonia sp. 24A2 TaxID=3447364 RepID=UPI003F69AB60